MEENNSQVINFNGQDHYVVVQFDNGETQVNLTSNAITELVITESFMDWFISGWITIDNAYDHFERLPNFDDTPLPEIDLDYKYRGDGRDIIRVKIIPKVSDQGDSELPQLELKPEVWEIYFEGVLYDVEELEGYTVDTKKKRFYFWEKEYHLMSEKNVEFTTANVGANEGAEDIHKLSNDERSLRTGEALLELFKATPELAKKVPAKVGPDWAAGDEKNTIMYTSPSNYKLIDDANDILMAHTNSKEDDYDICFLKYNRRKANKTKLFSFESLSSFFEKAGTVSANKYQTEVFTLMDMSETATNIIPIGKTPQGGTIPAETNIRSLTTNEIAQYQFNEMSGVDSADLIAVFSVHTYNNQYGQFNVHVINNTPQKAKEFQDKQYVRKIGPDSHTRLQLNTWKTNGTNLQNVFSSGGRESCYAFGRNRIIKSCLLNGAAITFDARVNLKTGWEIYVYQKRK